MPNGADGEIVLGLQISETLALIQSQLNQISKNLNLQITGKLNKPATKAQLKSDLTSMNVSQKIGLTGKLDKSKTKAQLKTDIGTLSKQVVQLQAKINTSELQKQIQKANVHLDTSVDGSEELKEVGNSLDTINKKSAATVASVTALHQAFTYLQRAAKQIVDTAADLNKQLTDLRMVTGNSYDEVYSLISDYTELAKSLGATTTQVVSASDEWLRQGMTVSETEQLITQSMYLSKVGAMDSATATENLTSAMRGYGLAVEDVAGIVDSLTSIDLKAAVTASDLAVAMSRTAASASIAGVSMDKLLGYIAAVEETTQKSAETVGESIKTMFARMNNIKLGNFIDDDGESLNDTEKILNHFGIALRDTEGEFRAVSDVLDEVYSKWDTFTALEKSSIAVATAGTRQRENFLVLMENYGKALEYTEVAANSAGTAMEKFSAYQEGVEAHYNSLIASAEALSMQTVPASLMNGIMDAAGAVLDFLTATNLLTIALASLGTALSVKGLAAFGGKIKSLYQSVANLSTAFNILGKSADVNLAADEFEKLLTVTKGLNAQQLKLVVSNKALTTEQRIAILTASGLTAEEAQQTLAAMGLATAEGATTAATFSLSGAFKALTAAIAANPIGFLLVALTTAITVFSTIKNKIDEANQAVIDAGNEAAEHAKNIVDLANAYFDLADAVDAGAAAKEDMVEAQDDIINALGLEGKSVDELKDKYGDLRTAIRTIALDQLETDISKATAGANTAKKSAVSDLESYLGTSISDGNGKDVFEYLQSQGFSGISVGTSGGVLTLPTSDIWDAFSDPSFEGLTENKEYLKDAMNAVRDKFGNDNAVFKQLSDAYSKYEEALEPAVEAIDNSNKLIADYWVQTAESLNDPKTKEEFETFKQSVIDNINSDLSWDADGSFSAEGIVDSILQSDRQFSQFYDEIDTALESAEDTILSHSERIKSTLETLWSSEDFSNTKKSIEEMAAALGGITADNIDTLIASSGELAALLEEDGMNAQFLAHILQTVADGGDGFALITNDALTLNDALNGMRDRFDEVTDAKSRYDSAMSIPEKDTNFKSYTEAFKELNEQFEAGTTNSNAFWAAAEFLFGADQLQEWGWSDGLDEIYAAMKKNVDIFGEADSAGEGFLDRLYELSEAGEIKADDGSVIGQIEKLSDGTYDFNFDSGNLDALAEKLGITSESAMACMQALSMYGDFNFYDINAVMDAVKEIGLSSDALDGTAVNVSALTDQLISLGYTNKDIYDLLNVLKEVDGVTLLDADANIDTLTQSLSDLGLAAQDGVNVTVNADGLSDLMSQLNFTKDDTQNLITKLGEADGVTLTNAQGEVITLNDALEHTDELQFAGVTSELDGITDSAELAQNKVDDLQVSINKLTGKTVTVTLDVQRKSGILGSIFGYAKGTDGAPEGDALVGEEGEELIQSGDHAYIAGKNGAELVHLNKGDRVYTADETKRIKRDAKIIRGVVPAFAGGTELGKPTSNSYSSVLPDSSNSTSSNTSSSTSNAESEFERLYKYHQHLLNMDQENVSDYLKWLDTAYKKAYQNGEIELDDYYKYEEEVFEKIKSVLDDSRKEHENAITLTENLLNNAIVSGDSGKITQYTGEIVDHYKAMQDELHTQAEYYRSLGYSDTSDEVSKLSDMWWDYYDEIKNVSADAWQQVVDNANDALDSITGLYDTLKTAAQEYAENGYITIDTLQDICALGVENLAYLQDENGQLVINEANIQKVIAARTQQMAIESALNYIQQFRQAVMNNDAVALLNLTTATSAAASSTWDLVYAQLQLLGLSSDQYNNALQRINTLRSLTDITVSGIGKVDGAAKKAIESQADALEDLLKYVEDMIKQEVENQIDALEKQVDSYKEIVDLQKKSLDLEREKNDYTKSVAKKEEEIANLRKQIYALDLDDSREAAAQKAKLQEELSEKINDLADYQSDHAYDATSDALDDMADVYEKEKNDEINILKDSISSEEKLYQLAISRISNNWSSLYQDLINWNYEYGSVTSDELTSAWNTASSAVRQYGSYLDAVLETQRQIASFDADSGSSNTSLGNMGDYDTSGGNTMAQIKDIVHQMKSNSAAHHSADTAGKARLNKANLELGSQLAALIGRTVVRGDDGVWYLDRVGGTQLYSTYPYSTYHTGGIAGDEPDLKQNEIFAKLEKKEAIITEPQQKTLWKVLDFQDTMIAKYGKLFDTATDSDMIGDKLQTQIKKDAQQAQNIVENSNYNITVTAPVQVYPMQKMDDAEVKQLSQKISDNTITRINDAFIKRGKKQLGTILKP